MDERDRYRKTDAIEAVLKTLKTLNYDFVKNLGEGLVGSVIEVKSPYSQQSIAVKIVLEEDVKQNELKIWPLLSHPNMVRLISTNYIDAGRAYIFLMEKCVTSLEQKLGDPGFIFDSKALQTAKCYVKEILDAVSYLHEQNYAHMDLKLNNVLIDNEGKAVVADFDSITSTEKKTSSYGSPVPYRPPEAFCFVDRHWGPVDAKYYDSWTLGMLCVRVFTRENFNTDLRPSEDFWENIIYPKLFDLLQRERFLIKMKMCFPRSKIGLEEVDQVLSLVRSFLRLDPGRRISPQDALKQKLFGGQESDRMEKDNLWKRKMDPQKLRKEIKALHDSQRMSLVSAQIRMAVKEVESKIVVTPAKIVTDKNLQKDSNDEKGQTMEKNEKGDERDIVPSRKDNDEIKRKADALVKPSETILSALKLLDEVENNECKGIYLKEMSTIKDKRTRNIFMWAKEKKNTLMKRLTSTNK